MYVIVNSLCIVGPPLKKKPDRLGLTRVGLESHISNWWSAFRTTSPPLRHEPKQYVRPYKPTYRCPNFAHCIVSVLQRYFIIA